MVHNDKIGANDLERSAKISSYGLERSQLDTIQKSGHMVLKGVNGVDNGKIWSNGLEWSQ